MCVCASGAVHPSVRFVSARVLRVLRRFAWGGRAVVGTHYEVHILTQWGRAAAGRGARGAAGAPGGLRFVERVHPRQRAEAAEGVDMFLYTGPGRAGSVSRMLSGTRRESALARSLRWVHEKKHDIRRDKKRLRMADEPLV